MGLCHADIFSCFFTTNTHTPDPAYCFAMPCVVKNLSPPQPLGRMLLFPFPRASSCPGDFTRQRPLLIRDLWALPPPPRVHPSWVKALTGAAQLLLAKVTPFLCMRDFACS